MIENVSYFGKKTLFCKFIARKSLQRKPIQDNLQTNTEVLNKISFSSPKTKGGNEVYPNPTKALSDAANCIRLDDLDKLVGNILSFHRLHKDLDGGKT